MRRERVEGMMIDWSCIFRWKSSCDETELNFATESGAVLFRRWREMRFLYFTSCPDRQLLHNHVEQLKDKSSPMETCARLHDIAVGPRWLCETSDGPFNDSHATKWPTPVLLCHIWIAE